MSEVDATGAKRSRAISAAMPPALGRAAVLLPAFAGPGLVAWMTALAVALYLWRSGQSAVHPQLVAEDGRVFFVGAKLDGLRSLAVPYADYLHLLPRIGALAASAFPSPRAPALYLAFAAAAVAWASATIASTGQRHAWALAPLAMLVPTDGEVFGTLTNVQWLTGPALALVLSAPAPKGRLARVNQLAFVAVASLTGPFSIFAAPVALWRLWEGRRDGFAWPLCGLALAGASVQLAWVAQEPMFLPAPDAAPPFHFATTLLDRWIGQAAHAGRSLRPAHARDAAALVAAVAVAACSEPRLAARLHAFAGLGLLATFLRYLYDNAYFNDPHWVERYFYIPRLVLLWTLALCLLRLRPASVAGLVGVVLMLAAAESWVKPPYPRLPWAEPARAIDRGLPVRIVINPSPADDATPEAWTVTLPARGP